MGGCINKKYYGERLTKQHSIILTKELREKKLNEWNVFDVISWIQTAPIFAELNGKQTKYLINMIKEHHIEGKSLQTLNDNDLKIELKLNDNQRIVFLKALKQLLSLKNTYNFNKLNPTESNENENENENENNKKSDSNESTSNNNDTNNNNNNNTIHDNKDNNTDSEEVSLNHSIQETSKTKNMMTIDITNDNINTSVNIMDDEKTVSQPNEDILVDFISTPQSISKDITNKNDINNNNNNNDIKNGAKSREEVSTPIELDDNNSDERSNRLNKRRSSLSNHQFVSGMFGIWE